MLRNIYSLLIEEKGSVGILSVIVMLLLGVVGAAYISLSSTEVSSSASYRNGVAAQFLAEAGARRAIVELDKNNAWTGVANVSLGSGSTAGQYTVVVTAADSDRTVVAQGTVGNAVRKVVLRLTLSGGAFLYPAFSGNQMTVNSGLVVEGGNIATSKNQVTNNGYTGTILTDVPNVAMPEIPVSFQKNEYSHGNTTTLSNTPNTANYNLSGLYYIDGNFTTNSGVNLQTTGSNNATIYAEGDITINGNITGNITLIAKKNITINSGGSISGAIHLYSEKDMVLNRSMTGDLIIMSKQDVTINSGASVLNQAAIYAKHDITFNAGVHLTGVIVADNKATFNGGRITYKPVGFSSTPGSSTSLIINSWGNQ